MVEGFYFCLQGLEVLVDHFEQDVSFLFIGGGVLISDFLYFSDSVGSVHLLAFLVVFDATLGLTDGTG